MKAEIIWKETNEGIIVGKIGDKKLFTISKSGAMNLYKLKIRTNRGRPIIRYFDEVKALKGYATKYSISRGLI